MKYLNSESLNEVGLDWSEILKVVEDAILIKYDKDYSQPVKPYLRFMDRKNRIIAMPAYLGGKIGKAGIKWIASFPDNIDKGISRASSLTILNNIKTGIPECIINSTMISEIRTAAVTGVIIKKFFDIRTDLSDINIGISGFGPIGKIHLDMILALFDKKIKNINIFDIRDIKSSIEDTDDRVNYCENFEDSFKNAHIFITATASESPYINLKPKEGSLHLNVSLRDYESSFLKYVSRIIVDDWDEVCRENTDIERMNKYEGLKKEDTLSMEEFIIGNKLEKLGKNEVVMFNPMGMAIFDIAVGCYYLKKSNENKIGLTL